MSRAILELASPAEPLPHALLPDDDPIPAPARATVNHILRTNHGKRVAIIENEFGEVGVDDGLVVETK